MGYSLFYEAVALNIFSTGDLISVTEGSANIYDMYEQELGECISNLSVQISNAIGVVLPFEDEQQIWGAREQYIPVFVVDHYCFVHRSRLKKVLKYGCCKKQK